MARGMVDVGRPIAVLSAGIVGILGVWLLMHPAIAKTMGENGRKAVLSRFNWGAEEKKLVDFYSRLLVKQIN